MSHNLLSLVSLQYIIVCLFSINFIDVVKYFFFILLNFVCKYKSPDKISIILPVNVDITTTG